MITRQELEGFARIGGLSLGNAEKDYLLDIALLSISRAIKNELVFKGGTCLYKFYRLSRFSEDLDFSAVQDIDIDRLLDKVITDFARFGVSVKLHEKKEPHTSVLVTLRAQGPLYHGTQGTIASLGIDINKKSTVVLGPEVLAHRSIYPDIPGVGVLCMKREEIFAEKILALMTRERARDLFDLYFLLTQGVAADKSLIESKLVYYGKTFEPKALLHRLSVLHETWPHLKGFTRELPEFARVRKAVVTWIGSL